MKPRIVILLTVLSIAAVAGLAWCGRYVYSKSGGSYVLIGNAHRDKEEYDAAIADYDKALAILPGNADAHLQRGIAWSCKDDTAKAFADFDAALRLDPAMTEAYLWRGTEYRILRKYSEALADVDAFVQKTPADYRGYRQRGFVLEESREFDKAIADYSAVLEFKPGEGYIYYRRGECHIKKGEFDLALPDFTAAIGAGYKVSAVYNDRGYLYRLNKMYDKAIADYSEAIKATPDKGLPYVNRAEAYELNGMHEKALADFDNAIRVLTVAIVSDPTVMENYRLRRNVYSKKGERAAALADDKVLLKAVPKTSNEYNSLAWKMATSPEGELRDGKKAVDYALKGCELSQWRDSYLVATLAGAYAETGDFDNAVKFEQWYLTMPGVSEEHLADGKARLALYEKHEPYREEEK